MGFLKNLFRKKEIIEEEAPLYELIESQIENDEERRKFISASLLQMKEISSDIDALRAEYNAVTSFLNDCDELDRIPDEVRYPIEKAARDIITVKENKDKYFLEKPLIDEYLYDKMDKLSDDMPGAYDKLKEAEEFQSMIKADLRRVEGEKQAYYYRRGELDGLIKNTVGVLVIATVSAVICFIVLLVLGLSMNMDVKLGFLLTVTIICGVYCFLFLKGNDLRKESNKLEKTIIKIIQLQNSVKIRLVNNTNLLDYLYLKYDVDSSKELKANFESYETERTRREQYEQASKDLPMAKKLLLSLLRDLPISDPISWVHTPEAIVNKNEMVELRHEMISRRQKLREQIEDSTESAEGIKEEIKEIIKRYPRYSVEIMEMLKDFESTNKFE